MFGLLNPDAWIVVHYFYALPLLRDHECFKDGAYFCYCAYVLRISRYSGFLWWCPLKQGYFCMV